MHVCDTCTYFRVALACETFLAELETRRGYLDVHNGKPDLSRHTTVRHDSFLLLSSVSLTLVIQVSIIAATSMPLAADNAVHRS